MGRGKAWARSPQLEFLAGFLRDNPNEWAKASYFGDPYIVKRAMELRLGVGNVKTAQSGPDFWIVFLTAASPPVADPRILAL